MMRRPGVLPQYVGGATSLTDRHEQVHGPTGNLRPRIEPSGEMVLNLYLDTRSLEHVSRLTCRPDPKEGVQEFVSVGCGVQGRHAPQDESEQGSEAPKERDASR